MMDKLLYVAMIIAFLLACWSLVVFSWFAWKIVITSAYAKLENCRRVCRASLAGCAIYTFVGCVIFIIRQS